MINLFYYHSYLERLESEYVSFVFEIEIILLTYNVSFKQVHRRL